MRRTALILAMILSFSPIAFAHPGHGFVEGGAGHFFTSPIHIGIPLMTIVLLFAVYRLYRNARLLSR